MPLSRLEAVGHRGIAAYEAERHRRKIIEKAGLFGIYERNVFIEEADLATRRYRGIERGKLAVKLIADARILCFFAQRPDRRTYRRQLIPAREKLPRRGKHRRLYLLGHALCGCVEQSHAVYLVAEKFDTQRKCAAVTTAVGADYTHRRRGNIYDPAAHRELSRALNKAGGTERFRAGRIGADIARSRKTVHKRGNAAALAVVERDRNKVIRERRRGHRIAESGVRRGEYNVKKPAADAEQHTETVVFELARSGYVIKVEIAHRVKRGAKSE